MQPNFIVFAPDDLGREQVRQYGFDNLHTEPLQPNLDRLIQNGVLFRNAHTQPWCSPTRACWHTGRYGFKTGIGQLAEHEQQPLLSTEICLPAALDQATGGVYAKACIGKWHLSDFASVGGEIQHPVTCGYDFYAGTLRNLEGGDSYFSWRMSQAERTPRGIVTSQTMVEEYLPLWNVKRALEWINSTTQPFFLYLPINLPHEPIHRPPTGFYDAKTYNLPDAVPNANASQATVNAYSKAMIQSLDKCLGLLLAGLTSAQRANTIILWWSDNGTSGNAANVTSTTAPWSPTNPSSGDILSHLKRTPFEGGLNTPLVISGPGVKSPGRSSTDLISCVDLMATMIDAAGGNYSLVSPPPNGGTRDSISFWPVLNQAVAGTRTSLIACVFGPNSPNLNASTPGARAIVLNNGYKLLRANGQGVTGFPTIDGSGNGVSNGRDMLFNLNVDKYEGADLLLSGSPVGTAFHLSPADAAAYNTLVPLFASIQSAY